MVDGERYKVDGRRLKAHGARQRVEGRLSSFSHLRYISSLPTSAFRLPNSEICHLA